MKSTTRKTLFASTEGLTLASGMAACVPAANQSAAKSPSTNAPAASSATSSDQSSSPSSGAKSPYKDGAYQADGSYISPNGQEKLGVELTLTAGTVTNLKLTSYPSNPNTKRFQGEFISGVDAQVVGKSIDSLNVSKVSGSSLTSGGFNDAIAQIKKEAAQK
ncbi:FMN-binding protein [Renibacterium salmoninarum]|nr:hypothetical protein [Renibacterium salmoninarum]